MNNLLNIKNSIAIILILFGLTLAVEKHRNPVQNTVVLNIDQPSDKILSMVQPIAKLITDPNDRAKLAIFNQEFASRILRYEINNQQTNDIYVLAASNFFKNSLNDKYQGLDVAIIELLQSSIGNDNHVLSENEKIDISNKFMGLSWALIERK